MVCVSPPEPVDNVTLTDLLVEPLRAYAPPGADLAQPPSTWGPWVTFPQGSHSRHLIAIAVARAGAPFHVVAESHQPEVLREMVRLGLGWTVLPVVQAESGDEPMVPARVRPLAERTLVLAHRADTVHDPAAAELAAVLAAT